MNDERYLVCVSGPAGVGKGTVVKRLIEKHPEIAVSVSATTRQPRPGEVNHQAYHFITVPEFEENIRENRMLEYNNYCGNYYGTLKSEVDDRISKGQVVILEIDVNGTGRVKELYPQALTVFILPPSIEVLESRLVGRGTETPEVVAKRMARAREELAIAQQYDVKLVNQEVEACVEQLYNIIQENLQ